MNTLLIYVVVRVPVLYKYKKDIAEILVLRRYTYTCITHSFCMLVIIYAFKTIIYIIHDYPWPSR